MDRRRFLLTSLAGALAAPLAAEGQLASRVYRIGYLSYLGCSDDPFLRDPFRQGLRELGYVEGRNLVIECRGAPGKPDRFADLVAELVRLNVDALVAVGTPFALAAKQATGTVPIVMVYIGDPVGSGLVSSLARPGANVTGSSMLASEMVQKNLELLKEAAPSVSRVTVLIDSSNPGQTLPDQQMAAAAKVLGVRPQRVVSGQIILVFLDMRRRLARLDRRAGRWERQRPRQEPPGVDRLIPR